MDRDDILNLYVVTNLPPAGGRRPHGAVVVVGERRTTVLTLLLCRPRPWAGMMHVVSITPARQRNAVSEGVALGLVLCGINSVPSARSRVDLPFESAWSSWEYCDQFPQVNTDLAKGLNASLAMTHADKNKRTRVLYWDTSERGKYRIAAHQSDWDPTDDDDVEYAVSAIDGGVPADGWVSLARKFLASLGT